MKTPRFWKMLEELGQAATSRKDFQNQLGENKEYPVVERFIVRQVSPDGANLTVAGYPCEKCQKAHRVDAEDPQRIYAYLNDREIECEDITGLSLDDVWRRLVDVEGVGRAVAVALSAEPEFTCKGDGLWRIGMTERRRAVFLSLHGSDGAYDNDADALRATTRGQFLLLTGTPRGHVAERFGRDGGACFALGDVVDVTPRGLTAVATAESLLVLGLPGPAPAGSGRVLPVRGKRFEIEVGYIALTRVKPRKRFPISTLNCREALRVLVDGGHSSEATAIHKRDWCQAVWAARHPERPVLGDSKPIQFFRVRRARKTVTVPWYKDVIATDDHGLYWLKL